MDIKKHTQAHTSKLEFEEYEYNESKKLYVVIKLKQETAIYIQFTIYLLFIGKFIKQEHT